jgi:hypothetical protein
MNLLITNVTYLTKHCFLFSALVILFGCSSFPSENIDPNKNNKDAFRKDLAECKQDYGESGSGIHFKQWTNCMNLKGWK